MNQFILASEQFAIAPSLETDAPERDRLAECGFTAEEIVASSGLDIGTKAVAAIVCRSSATGSSSSGWS